MPQLPHRLQPLCRHSGARVVKPLLLFIRRLLRRFDESDSSSSDRPSAIVSAQLSSRPVRQQPFPGKSQMHMLLSNVSGGGCKTNVIGNGSSPLMIPCCKHFSRRSCSKVRSRSFHLCTYIKGCLSTTMLKYPCGHAIWSLIASMTQEIQVLWWMRVSTDPMSTNSLTSAFILWTWNLKWCPVRDIIPCPWWSGHARFMQRDSPKVLESANLRLKRLRGLRKSDGVLHMHTGARYHGAEAKVDCSMS